MGRNSGNTIATLHLKSSHNTSNRCGGWRQPCLGENSTEAASRMNKN
jgi:hypothetical protein